MSRNYIITWEGLGRETTIVEGQTILENAIENDIPLNHACGGYCACTTCHVILVNGFEYVSQKQPDETDLIAGKPGAEEHSRLGCQSKVFGNLIVRLPKDR